MAACLVHGHARGVDGLNCSHAVTFDAGDLDETADGVAGHTEVVFHGDLRGVFDLFVGAVERSYQSAGGHGAGNPDLALASDFSSGDAGVFFIEDSDGGGGEEVTDDSSFVSSIDETQVVVREGGNDACSSVGGGGDNAATCCVLFIDGHGVDRDPVHRGEWVL